MTQTIECLDFSKPPPGHDVDCAICMSQSDGVTRAWAHYKASYDPPGMWSGFYGRLPDLKVYTPRMGLVHGMELWVPESEHPTPETARATGRAAAWVRYERWLTTGQWFEVPAAE